MYILSFFKNLFRKQNIGTMIWMTINLAIFLTLFYFVMGGSYSVTDGMIGILIGFAAYVLSCIIALSVIGETILRWQLGCKKIKDEEVENRLRPIFDEVYQKAKQQNPDLSDKIKLYINKDECPHAFATGRHTVCVTKGLLLLSDEEIKGILAHEFGHLAHKDTDVILIVQVGNLIITGILTAIRIYVNIVMILFKIIFFFSDSIEDFFLTVVSKIFIDFLIGGIIWLWTKLGVLICMTSSRKNEYEADRYAFKLGYAKQLINAFCSLGEVDSKPKGLFAALSSSHPATDKRIEALNNLLTEQMN